MHSNINHKSEATSNFTQGNNPNHSIQNIVEQIIKGNKDLAGFWSKSQGWAPPEAAELMSKSRQDWQVSLSETLHLWTSVDMTDGELILAWANLGALVEGTLKLYLSIYLKEYLADTERVEQKGKTVEPDALALERLKVFFTKKELLDLEWLDFITTIQQRRNAIHAFKCRPIGDKIELHEFIEKYLNFMRHINNRFPYPDNWHRIIF